MCSTFCCPALHVSFSSVASISSHKTHFGRAHVVASPLRPVRVTRRIRGFAGENGVSKEETTTADENGKAGAAVTDAAKGFGASAAAKPASTKEKKKRSNAGTIRRSAPQQPLLQSAPVENQVSQIETAYVVSLTFLFGLIFVEGIALSASGGLPLLFNSPVFLPAGFCLNLTS